MYATLIKIFNRDLQRTFLTVKHNGVMKNSGSGHHSHTNSSERGPYIFQCDCTAYCLAHRNISLPPFSTLFLMSFHFTRNKVCL